MGLDGVELILEVEETFGVSIDDAAAERITTVGELWDYICARVEFSPFESCATASAFYRFRRAVSECVAVDRCQLYTASPLDSLLPREARRATWAKLEQAAQLTFPKLELHPRLNQAPLALATLVAAAIAATYFVLQGAHSVSLLVAVLIGFLVSLTAIDRAMTPLRTHFNPAWTTMGGVARALVGLNPQAWSTAERSKEVSWERFRTMIARQLDVSLDLVRPEASFVNDLGMS